MGRSVWIVVMGISLLVGGCNVFDVSMSGPRSIEDLLADARSALTAGDTSRAVQLLERAYDEDSTDVRVRVELGNALYADRGLDLFTLRAAAEHLIDPSKSTGSSTASPSPHGTNSVCTDDAQPDSSSDRYAFVPLEADPLLRLVERSEVVERVRRLVVEGVLQRPTAAFSDAGVRVRRKGLLVGAVTVTADAGTAVHEVFEAPESTLFLDRDAQSGGAFLACADTEDLLRQNHDALCTLHTAADRAGQWLQARNRLSGSDQTAVLIGRLQTIAESIVARIECSN